MSALAQTCPSCGALAGKPCLSATGREVAPHQQRTPEGRAARDARKRADMARYWEKRIGAKP